MKTIIEIDNITEAQKIAIEDMLYTWKYLGQIGSSRWTSFFADGDGNFRPQIKIDGEIPKETNLINKENKWKQAFIKENDKYKPLYNTYFIDFDSIAWKIRE